MSQRREYVLGTNNEELYRLGFQHRLWSRAAHALWERASIRPGERVLDIGCGPGFASFDLAQIVGPTGGVDGLDESQGFVQYASAQAEIRGLGHARFHVGDVMDMPGRSGLVEETFDLAYARWVMCFVPDPVAVVRGAARMLRSGGRVCVQDYFRYETMSLAPRSAAFEAIIAGIASSWRARGGDPDIMGRLPGLLIGAGFEVTHLGPTHVGPARPGSTMWEWPDSFWRVFVPRLEELGHVTRAQREAFFAEWSRACADKGSFMHLPPVYELIAVKR